MNLRTKLWTCQGKAKQQLGALNSMHPELRPAGPWSQRGVPRGERVALCPGMLSSQRRPQTLQLRASC